MVASLDPIGASWKMCARRSVGTGYLVRGVLRIDERTVIDTALRLLFLILAFIAPTHPACSHPSAQGSVQAQKSVTQRQYIRAALTKVARSWIPTRSRKNLVITVKWNVHKNGTISDIEIVCPGKSATGEARAKEAVRRSAPFAPLPDGINAPLEIKAQFQTTSALQLTVQQAVKHYGTSARKVLAEKCRSAGVEYPPKNLVMIGLKQERKLVLLGGDSNSSMKVIGAFPLVSYSGVLGPKLKEGDLQIPEGIYRITGFQSHNMLALYVDYPNELDRKNAMLDHRTKLGGDILIHGGSQSTGCLVVSDDDMELLFIAAHDVGLRNIELIIAPCDLTAQTPKVDLKSQPRWLPGLYESLKLRMRLYFPQKYSMAAESYVAHVHSLCRWSRTFCNGSCCRTQSFSLSSSSSMPGKLASFCKVTSSTEQN